MKRYLVRFENMAVFSVSELSEGLLLAISGDHIVSEDLNSIEQMLNSQGIGTVKITEFKGQNGIT
jgi:hypothetical protein